VKIAKLHKGQYEVATDVHRFRVICAGRRWGKSTLAQLIVMQWAARPGLYWIVNPTYKQAKMIHWRELKKLIPREWIQKTNETELSFTLKNGSIIELKGADNPDALRGVKLHGLVIDEIAAIRNWDWLWQEVLRPTLTDYVAPAIFISTPKGYNHFYDIFQSGQGEKVSDYKSWRFTSYDNPYIPREEIENAERELSKDAFAQEYMADFRTAVGLAHSLFDRNLHILKPFDIPSEWQRGRGFDYGSAHPTASVRIAIDGDDNWFWERTYNASNKIIKDHAEVIKAQDYAIGFVPAFGDPSGKQWFLEFSQHDLHIQPANKEVGQNARGWVEHCVEKVNERLKPVVGHTVRLPDGTKIENAPRLFVIGSEENEPGIKQMENLKWKTIKNTDETVPMLDESDDPTGGHYDILAALRYFAVSYNKQDDSWDDINSGLRDKWRI